jgi:hypothetical protein
MPQTDFGRSRQDYGEHDSDVRLILLELCSCFRFRYWVSGFSFVGVSVLNEPPDVIDLPIDGILDLHTFQPGEAKGLVADYLAACREKHILTVRIIHGKGTGQLKRIVVSVLGSMDEVMSYGPAGEEEGGWGATIVELKPR